MKTFNQSPLPFQGQKRNFVKSFKMALKDYPPDATYIDIFGGSGLLAHTVKSIYPMATVVYNDYDEFTERLKAIPRTNRLISDLREILGDCDRKLKITGEYKERVIELLIDADKEGFNDWITISSNLLFSMNYATSLGGIIKETMYNKVRLSNYDATGYLDGVKVVGMDYKQLYEQYKDKPGVVFLVDPPYLSTDTATYGSNGYWKLRDYLDVLQVLHDHNYFYFTSNKSQIVELCEWISTVSSIANPFENAQKTTVNVSTSHNSGYIDFMYHYKRYE